jgi:hypothetical protein
MSEDRYFYHSFPRPKAGESRESTVNRGLQILAFMREVGLILAPEVVTWNAGALSLDDEKIQILQKRACFTELSVHELRVHAEKFGPISLEFKISDLRRSGAMPVIYAPQGIDESLPSLLATFIVRGAWHTEKLLRSLDNLKAASDPKRVPGLLGLPVNTPVDPSYKINLQSLHPEGRIENAHEVSADAVRRILDFVGYRSIPFDHSIAFLDIIMNIFYPTDNIYSGEILGYYRQREWRLIETLVNFNNNLTTRTLAHFEQQKLMKIDPAFWGREIIWRGGRGKRAELARVYQPDLSWNLVNLANSVIVPVNSVEKARAIVGPEVSIRSEEL